jgi:selenium metabolism protein YedF
MKIDNNLLLVLKSSGLGDGEPDLGLKLMSSFLTMLTESKRIPAKIICLNSGIYLTTSGSPVETQMKQFEQAGAEVYSCGTCLDYYGRRDMLTIGYVTNMRDTVTAMLEFEKVLSP